MSSDLINMLLDDEDDTFGPDFFTRLYEGYYNFPEIDYSLYEDEFEVFNELFEMDWEDFQEDEPENRGLHKQLIDSLPTMEIHNADETCSICIDNFNIKTKCIVLPCTHLFHQDCISKWLLQNDSCPICRYSIIQK